MCKKYTNFTVGRSAVRALWKNRNILEDKIAQCFQLMRKIDTAKLKVEQLGGPPGSHNKVYDHCKSLDQLTNIEHIEWNSKHPPTNVHLASDSFGRTEWARSSSC